MPRQLAIRAIEVMTGQPQLKRLYTDYRAEKLPHDARFGRKSSTACT